MRFEAAHDVIDVTDVICTIGPADSRRARRRSLVAEPVRWPAPRVTVRLVRTTATGQWRATCSYEGQSVDVVVPQKRLDDLVAFVARHLGGMENTVADAEAARRAAREG